MKRIKCQLIGINISNCKSWDEVFGLLRSKINGVGLDNFVELRIRSEAIEIKEVV